jgi:CIC family chloride channel protein
LSENNPGKILENTLFSDFKIILLLIFVGLTMMIKVFATGITLGAGGNGGNLRPLYLWVPILAMCFQN